LTVFYRLHQVSSSLTILLPNLTILLPNLTILHPNLTILLPHLTILLPHLTILFPNLTILHPNLTILLPNLTILLPSLTILLPITRPPPPPFPRKTFNFLSIFHQFPSHPKLSHFKQSQSLIESISKPNEIHKRIFCLKLKKCQ
jgi:hypothetical protein